MIWTVERERTWPTYDGVCSVVGCGVSFDDLGYLIDITVLTSPGEEGYAEITQWFCQIHYENVRRVLMTLGFVSHNHHGTNLLDAEDECGGYDRCLHPVEYGPELVVPVEPLGESLKTDHEYWEKVENLLPDFMDSNYILCEGWKCGVIASVALRNFHKFVAEKLDIETSTISYHTFYNSLRALGYDIPVVKGGYDANKTKIKGIARREV